MAMGKTRNLFKKIGLSGSISARMGTVNMISEELTEAKIEEVARISRTIQKKELMIQITTMNAVTHLE